MITRPKVPEDAGEPSGENADPVHTTSGTRKRVDATPPGGSVLFVEDDPLVQETFGRVLRKGSYDVCPALDLGEALQALRTGQFDVVLLDLLLPDVSGAEALRSIRRCKPDLPIVVMTGADNPFVISETAMLRPFAFLHKPIESNDMLLDTLARAIATTRAPRSPVEGFDAFLGSAKAIRQVLDDAAVHATAHSLPILLSGETGTGKDLLANCIHNAGPRREKPFVCVSCGAIAPSVAESQLFGRVAGAFADARRSDPGRFRGAHAGTLLLNDVQCLSLDLQTILLEFIETGAYFPVGSSKRVVVDVRIIAATNQEPTNLLAENRLLPDLYHRLAGVEIRIPPLCERREDIKELTAHFVTTLEGGKWSELRVEPDALEAMMNHPWPGNVRELRNMVARLCADSQGQPIRAEHLAFSRSSSPPPMSRERLVALLRQEEGNVARVAERLRRSRMTVYRWMDALRIDRKRRAHE